MDQTLIDKAAAEADRTAPGVTVTDLVPSGAARVGGLKATPINAASLRFLQAIARALAEDVEGEDAYLFSLYCRVRGVDRAGRSELWRLARRPLDLWAAYQEWLFGMSADDLNAMLADHRQDWGEVADAQEVADSSSGSGGGPEGNATGSQRS